MTLIELLALIFCLMGLITLYINLMDNPARTMGIIVGFVASLAIVAIPIIFFVSIGRSMNGNKPVQFLGMYL